MYRTIAVWGWICTIVFIVDALYRSPSSLRWVSLVTAVIALIGAVFGDKEK